MNKPSDSYVKMEADFIKIAGELNALREDGLRWRKLVALCGHWQDDSDKSITLSQDDATRQCLIQVGRNRYLYGSSFEAAIDESI